MAVSLSDIETKVRYLIGDSSTSGSDIFTYANSSVFRLTESNPISITQVIKNDAEMDTSEVVFDSDINTVTLSFAMTSGDTIEILYTYYANYSSTEIQNYVQAALVHISAGNYKDFIVVSSTIYPEPNDREENLIAMVTSLLIDPDNKTYRLPDVSVNVPRDLPMHDKIRKTIAIFKKDIHGFLETIGT